MLEIHTFLAIVYVLLTQSLFFLFAYPHVRQMTSEIGAGASVVAFLGTLMCVIFLTAVLLPAWIGLLAWIFFLISAVSGFELIHWTKYQVFNVALFVFCLVLSMVSLVTESMFSQVLYLAQSGIWMIGVCQGLNPHLLPVARSWLSGLGESYAELFVGILMTLCLVTIVAPLLHVDFPWYIQSPQILSDVGFTVGGCFAYVAKRKGIKLDFHSPTEYDDSRQSPFIDS